MVSKRSIISVVLPAPFTEVARYSSFYFRFPFKLKVVCLNYHNNNTCNLIAFLCDHGNGFILILISARYRRIEVGSL